MVPRLADSPVVGLVTEVTATKDVAEQTSLGDRVVLGRNSGDLSGKDTETKCGDGSEGSSREVHC